MNSGCKSHVKKKPCFITLYHTGSYPTDTYSQLGEGPPAGMFFINFFARTKEREANTVEKIMILPCKFLKERGRTFGSYLATSARCPIKRVWWGTRPEDGKSRSAQSRIEGVTSEPERLSLNSSLAAYYVTLSKLTSLCLHILICKLL